MKTTSLAVMFAVASVLSCRAEDADDSARISGALAGIEKASDLKEGIAAVKKAAGKAEALKLEIGRLTLRERCAFGILLRAPETKRPEPRQHDARKRVSEVLDAMVVGSVDPARQAAALDENDLKEVKADLDRTLLRRAAMEAAFHEGRGEAGGVVAIVLDPYMARDMMPSPVPADRPVQVTLRCLLVNCGKEAATVSFERAEFTGGPGKAAKECALKFLATGLGVFVQSLDAPVRLAPGEIYIASFSGSVKDTKETGSLGNNTVTLHLKVGDEPLVTEARDVAMDLPE